MRGIMVVDPLHNKNINFVTEQSAMYQYVHVPSRYYVFDTLMEDDPLEGSEDIFRGIKDSGMHYIVHSTSNNSSEAPDAECALCVTGKDLRDSLNVMKALSKYQSVGVTWFHIEDLKRARDNEYNCQMLELLIENFSLSPDVKSVQVKDSSLLFAISSRIMAQLFDCERLEKLVFTENSISANMKLDRILAELIHLKELDLTGCGINAYDCEELMVALQQLPLLEAVKMSGNSMTGCVEALITQEGLPCLRQFHLRDTKLGKDDAKILSEAVDSNLLPSLEDLDLADNNLKGSDLQIFYGALQNKRLSHLKKLFLTRNALTGSFGDFIGGSDHVGFQALKELHLERTEPNEDDMVHLVDAIKKGRFPALSLLDLEWNKMSEKIKKTTVRDLIESCLTKYRRNLEFKLNLRVNGFDGDDYDEFKAQCPEVFNLDGFLSM